MNVGRECRMLGMLACGRGEGGEGSVMPFLLGSSVCEANNTEIAAFLSQIF